MRQVVARVLCVVVLFATQAFASQTILPRMRLLVGVFPDGPVPGARRSESLKSVSEHVDQAKAEVFNPREACRALNQRLPLD